MKKIYYIDFETLYKKMSVLNSREFVFITTTNLSKSILTMIEILLKKDTGVAIFSFGISTKELMIKLFSIYTEISLKNIKIGNMSDNEWSRFNECVDFFSKSKLFIDDSRWLNINMLNKKIRKLKSKKPSEKFIFVILSEK